METNSIRSHIGSVLGEMPPVSDTLGQFIRWGPKKRYWCIINKDYKDRIFCFFGDWKLGISHKWAQQDDYFVKETKVIKETMDAVKKEQEAHDMPIRKYRDSIINEVLKLKQANDVDYMITKRIPPHRDIKDAEGFSYYLADYNPEDKTMRKKTLVQMKTNSIAVILRKTDGSIVGVQFINRKKTFVKGSKLKGSLLVFGDLDKASYFYVSEGVGTAGAVYTAVKDKLGTCSICAFNCNNMLDVVNEIRIKYPESKIILCQDNDEAGRNICLKIENKFENTVIKAPPLPENDFADISNTKAKKYLQLKEDDFIEIRSLGMTSKNYVFYSTYKKEKTECPINITRAHIIDIAPYEYWIKKFPNKKGEDIDVNACVNFLKKKARKQGSLDETKLRGSGYFLQNKNKPKGPLYAHSMGDTFLETDKSKVHLKGALIHMPKPISDDDINWLIQNVEDITRLAEKFCWSNNEFGKLLVGWLLSAPFCGCLPFRPHMWITGDSSSGKSWVLNNFVRPLLGNNAAYLTGGTTEAGLRAKLRNDSIPVVIDEFESEDLQESKKRRVVLELLRQASSQTDATIVKSSQDGTARTYQICTSALLASVRSALSFEANRNRFIALMLDSSKQKGQPFNRTIQGLMPERLEKIRELNINYIFFHYKQLYGHYDFWYKELRGDINEHLNRCYSVVAATLGMYGIGIYKDDIIKMVKASLSLVNNEEENCLNHLVNFELRYLGETRGTVLELVEELLYPDISIVDLDGKATLNYRVLKNNGMDFNPVNNALRIYYKHPKVIDIMSKYPDTNWVRTLLRLKNAKPVISTKGENEKGLHLRERCVELVNFLQNYKEV